MRRLGRWLVRGLTVFSLLLCVATAVLWVRSYSESDRLQSRSRSGGWWIWTARGSVEISLFRGDSSGQPADFYGLKYARETATPPYDGLVFFADLDTEPGDTETDWKWGGFVWSKRREAAGNVYDIGIAPIWSIALTAALLPLGWVIVWGWSRLHGRRWKHAGLCPSCGYDLRATPDRCPECGMVRAKA